MIIVSSAIEGLIFDCDGTLADTMPIHMTAWCETFREYGYTCPHELLNEVKGMPAVKIVETYNRRFGAAIDAQQFARDKNKLAYQTLSQARPIPAVIAVVDRFKNRLPIDRKSVV